MWKSAAIEKVPCGSVPWGQEVSWLRDTQRVLWKSLLYHAQLDKQTAERKKGARERMNKAAKYAVRFLIKEDKNESKVDYDG